MPEHDDDDLVMVGFSSTRNDAFNNEHERDELGYAWGEWRGMTRAAREDALNEYLAGLVDVFVVDQED